MTAAVVDTSLGGVALPPARSALPEVRPDHSNRPDPSAPPASFPSFGSFLPDRKRVGNSKPQNLLPIVQVFGVKYGSATPRSRYHYQGIPKGKALPPD